MQWEFDHKLLTPPEGCWFSTRLSAGKEKCEQLFPSFPPILTSSDWPKTSPKFKVHQEVVIGGLDLWFGGLGGVSPIYLLQKPGLPIRTGIPDFPFLERWQRTKLVALNSTPCVLCSKLQNKKIRFVSGQPECSFCRSLVDP